MSIIIPKIAIQTSYVAKFGSPILELDYPVAAIAPLPGNKTLVGLVGHNQLCIVTETGGKIFQEPALTEKITCIASGGTHTVAIGHISMVTLFDISKMGIQNIITLPKGKPVCHIAPKAGTEGEVFIVSCTDGSRYKISRSCAEQVYPLYIDTTEPENTLTLPMETLAKFHTKPGDLIKVEKSQDTWGYRLFLVGINSHYMVSWSGKVIYAAPRSCVELSDAISHTSKITCLAARDDGTYIAGAENGELINIAITSSLQQAIIVPD